MTESSGTGVLEKLGSTVKSIFGSWTTYTAIGTFALYFLGYLTLRFQLWALGVVTDLSALDERYFFAGARFLLYLVASLPNVFLLVAVFAPAIYVFGRFRGVRRLWMRVVMWLRRPNVPVLLGIVVSVVLIQKFMRPCFAFSNVLLGRSLPGPAFLRDSVLAEDEGFINLFFSGIFGAVLLNAANLYFVCHPREGGLAHPLLRNILIVLVAMEFLLLPINYGMLVVNRSLPRLADLGTPGVLNGRDAWLVLEGTEWITYLLRDGKTGERRVLSLPRREMKSIEVTCQDPILRILYLQAESPCAPSPPATKVSP